MIDFEVILQDYLERIFREEMLKNELNYLIIYKFKLQLHKGVLKQIKINANNITIYNGLKLPKSFQNFNYLINNFMEISEQFNKNEEYQLYKNKIYLHKNIYPSKDLYSLIFCFKSWKYFNFVLIISSILYTYSSIV